MCDVKEEEIYSHARKKFIPLFYTKGRRLPRSMSSDEEDLLAGLARPQMPMNAAVAGADEDDDDEEEEERPAATVQGNVPSNEAEAESDDDDATGGLVGAEAAFALDSAPDALELDPFRVAAGVEKADASGGAPGKQKTSNAAVSWKIFVGGLSHATDDAGLVKFFARYGKVQEATVVRNEAGGSRGFGFVTFVNTKGSKYCIQQAGDPPVVSIDGPRLT